MTLNRWKVLACTLTVGVGGLAVFAAPPSGNKAEPAKEPESPPPISAPLPSISIKPASPVNGDDTPAPAILPVKAEEPVKLPLTEAPMKTSKVEAPTKPAKADEF